ncbi:unnamed protein product, partial [Discosporangium mesarthrocarpum]
KTKRKGLHSLLPPQDQKSHPRLDHIEAWHTKDGVQKPMSVWEALSLSACPMELGVDCRVAREGFRSRRARIGEFLISMARRKVGRHTVGQGECLGGGGKQTSSRIMTL